MRTAASLACLAAILTAAPAIAQPAPRVAMRVTRQAHGPTVPAQGRPLVETVPQASAPGTLKTPYGLTVDNNGSLYVANLFGGITIYSAAHKLTATITTGVSGPAGVAISFAGNIYVANNTGNNITLYNPFGTQIGTITDASLFNPTGIYIDADDYLWVLDAQGTIHTYDPSGTPVSTLATNGGRTIGGWGPNVAIWGVNDPSGTGYQEFFENRGLVLQYGLQLDNEYGNAPKAGAEVQDRLGQEYVSDLATGDVQIWNAAGTYQVGTIKAVPGSFGLGIDDVRGLLYVSMPLKNEVLVYSTKPPYKYIGAIR